MNRFYFLAIAALPLILGSLRAPPDPELLWWTTPGLQKIRPFDPPPEQRPSDTHIAAARNEFEPFQLVLRAGQVDVNDIDVDVTDLRGPDRAVLPKKNITVYLERYLNLKMPSSIEGAAGEWPDALVPRIDDYTHERRSAFPFRIEKGRNQPVWLDVYVPLSTPAGHYSGKVLVMISGRLMVSIPYSLEVRNFDLPSTSSLATTFAFSSIPAFRQHYGKFTSDKDVAELTTQYEKAALWHRITLDASSGVAPNVTLGNTGVQINWDSYDRHISPLLNGDIFSQNDPLPGAKTTAVALHTPHLLTKPEQQIQYWRQVAEHFRQKGWFDRMFHYLWDEPARSQYAAMTQLGETVRRADPTVKNLVTAPFHDEWAGFIDIWSPLVNCFERKPNHTYCETVVNRSGYEDELAKGKRLWWYQSCASHGCNIVGGDYFTGWPSYMIDASPVQNRIMEWLTWKYRISGELYFNTNEAYFRKPNSWTDVHLFGGNGDGTLFYPGRPDVIGGLTNIPIESIRLKLIREGLEDYEYLVMLAKAKGIKAADTVVDSFVRRAWDFDKDPQKLYAAREEIARQLGR